MEHLPSNEIDKIADLVYNSIGYPGSIRTIFLSNVNKQFKSLLATDPIELLQLNLDLIALNRTERLTDGTIPFESWLEKASRYVKPYPDASLIIQKSLSKINSQSTFSPISNVQPPSDKAIENVVKEKIIHKNDMVSYAFLEGGFHAGNSVAKIKVKRYDNGIAKELNGQPATYLGTAWLLSKDLVITNHHVINARNNNEADASLSDFELQANNATIQFDFNADDMAGISYTFKKFEAADKGLDYCIIRLQAPGERLPLVLLTDKIVAQAENAEVVNIIQHPYGYSKKVALRNNHIYDSQYPHVRYFTDTEGGSSGSPVFNDNWQVIALHRASTLVENVNYNGESTAWVNEGVQMHAIIEHIKSNYNTLLNEINI